jgi:hypothetical protein
VFNVQLLNSFRVVPQPVFPIWPKPLVMATEDIDRPECNGCLIHRGLAARRISQIARMPRECGVPNRVRLGDRVDCGDIMADQHKVAVFSHESNGSYSVIC